MIGFQFNDGGRAAAGYKGYAEDCVCRAICIVTGLPYQQVYDRLAEGMGTQIKTRHYRKQRRSARNGVSVRRQWFKKYMLELGLVWTSCMAIGAGCKVHLRAEELPAGRLIASLSGHYCAVIDGVVHDIYLDDRDGTRCVYGYWRMP